MREQVEVVSSLPGSYQLALFERSELQRQIMETKCIFFGSMIRGSPVRA